MTLAQIAITDTSTHSYRTDPWNGSSGIKSILLGDATPPYRAYAIWVYNNTNQQLNVMPITNVDQKGTYPDATLIPSAVAVNPGDTTILEFEFARTPVQFLSLSLSYGTAPTAASNTSLPFGVTAILFTYNRKAFLLSLNNN